MVEKVTMYQISKELLEEEDIHTIPESASVKEANSNNCKYFKKVLNAVAIDEEIFKNEGEYSFRIESKEDIKSIIKKHATFSKLLKKHPNDRDLKLLTELTAHIKTLLINEIEDRFSLQSMLAKLELVTFIERQQLNKYLQSLSIPNFKETLSPTDEEILHMYYIEEMILLKRKFEHIRELFSGIRAEEVVNKSVEEIENSNWDELLEEISQSPKKIELDRLVIKDLLDTKKRKDTMVQKTIEELANRAGLKEKEFINELKVFRKKGYIEHGLFELSNERNYVNTEEYASPYQILEQAKNEYKELESRESKKSPSSKEITVLKEILIKKGLLNGQ
ncbi:hypothetical protein LCD52_21865 [Rossellomorea vietnamensis]|uniref:hypothetical protein n=1 Tax=Rossellomorea vietnamensis TaxID=218284 RepID=UPI001CCDAB65|nr:hypothetical protein [Rossellomorea vietnamensis]MCA0151351.1 hypothetical protein [Rossellomorea vietnamensis]